jgi:hypothetical protein
MPDDWESAHNLDPSNPSDAAVDSDSDGLTNLQEYLSGTDPRDKTSVLRLDGIAQSGKLTLRFTAQSGKGYSILYSSTVTGLDWTIAQQVSAQPSTRAIDIDVSQAGFYRVITPAKP